MKKRIIIISIVIVALLVAVYSYNSSLIVVINTDYFIGNKSIGSNLINVASNKACLGLYAADKNVNLYKYSVYVKSTYITSTYAKFVVYDAKYYPAKLIYTSLPFSVLSTPSWRTVDISLPLVKGAYWFGIVAQSSVVVYASQLGSNSQASLCHVVSCTYSSPGSTMSLTGDIYSLDPSSYVYYNIASVEGDMNGDGAVNSGDIRYLAMYLNGAPGYEKLYSSGDVNCDGRINSGDLRHLAIYISSNGADPIYQLYPTC